MFLSRTTLIELTGRKRPYAICRWLDQQRIAYLVGADGWPRVLEAQIVDRLGGRPQTREPRLRLT